MRFRQWFPFIDQMKDSDVWHDTFVAEWLSPEDAIKFSLSDFKYAPWSTSCNNLKAVPFQRSDSPRIKAVPINLRAPNRDEISDADAPHSVLHKQPLVHCRWGGVRISYGVNSRPLWSRFVLLGGRIG